MKAKKKEQAPVIVAAQGTQDGFFIKYRQGKREWIESQPYSQELYIKLLPYLGFA